MPSNIKISFVQAVFDEILKAFFDKPISKIMTGKITGKLKIAIIVAAFCALIAIAAMNVKVIAKLKLPSIIVRK